MKKFKVTWEIEVDAEDANGAAIEALDCIINGTARVFTATDGPGVSKEVDLMEYGNGGAKVKKEAGPLIWSGEEGICPKCGGDLELDEEESDGEGIGTANWTCPDCGAAGVQVREAVFQYHRDVETPEDTEAKAKAALFPEGPRTMHSTDGTLEFKAIGAGSGKWGPQISREEAARLLRAYESNEHDGVNIYCKEASDSEGALWAGIESGDLDEKGQLPEGWNTLEIMFEDGPHTFER